MPRKMGGRGWASVDGWVNSDQRIVNIGKAIPGSEAPSLARRSREMFAWRGIGDCECVLESVKVDRTVLFAWEMAERSEAV